MAKSHPSHHLAPVVRPRPGEAPSVDVVFHDIAKVNGQTFRTMSVDLATAAVPDRKYLAERCEVRFEHGTVKLLFGQERIGKPELRSLLVIHMSPGAVTRFLDSLVQLKPSLEEIGDAIGISPDKGISISEEPQQTVALRAGIVMAAISNDEGCLDFFQASPFAMGNAVNSNRLALDPVVRVDISTAQLLFLVRELRKLAQQFPPPRSEKIETEK